MTPPRTLVVHVGGVGDFLLACPSIAVLSADGPVELAGLRDRLQLAVAGGIAEAAYSSDAVDFFSLFSEPTDRLTAFLGRFDRAVVWIRDDGRIAEVLGSAGIRDVRVFPGLPPRDWGLHASLYYLDRLGQRDPGPTRLDFGVCENTGELVVHPGSGGEHKNWPLARFEGTVGELGGGFRRIVWCRGPAEEELEYPAGAEVIDTPRLVDLARRLAGAALYIGNDSGVTHLAAAAGCPTVAVFTRTDPRVWAPRGGHVRVVRDASGASVAAVVEAARALVRRLPGPGLD